LKGLERRKAAMLDGNWSGIGNKQTLFPFISCHSDKVYKSQIQELEVMLSRGVPLKKKIPPPASAQHGRTGISLQDERALSATEAHIASQLEYINDADPPLQGAQKVSRTSY
jgi:hypothetical protein